MSLTKPSRSSGDELLGTLNYRIRKRILVTGERQAVQKTRSLLQE
jgi:hypothetical protein